MCYESHLGIGPVFRRSVIDKSCANCIYSICQVVLYSRAPGSVPRAGAVFVGPLTRLMLGWGLLFGSSGKLSSIASFQREKGTGKKVAIGNPTHESQGPMKRQRRMQCAARQGQTKEVMTQCPSKKSRI